MVYFTICRLKISNSQRDREVTAEKNESSLFPCNIRSENEHARTQNTLAFFSFSSEGLLGTAVVRSLFLSFLRRFLGRAAAEEE